MIYKHRVTFVQDSKERVRLKRMATDHDRLVMAMGPDVLKRKREALLANPSFVLYADDCKIIDLDLFENLDKACRTCQCVVHVLVFLY